MFVIAAVTTAMIAILSAFNGIEAVVTELFGTLDAPLAVVPASGSELPAAAGEWIEATFGIDSDQPIVNAVAPVIEQEAVVSWAGNQPHVCAVLAFDSTLLSATPIASSVRSGKWSSTCRNPLLAWYWALGSKTSWG